MVDVNVVRHTKLQKITQTSEGSFSFGVLELCSGSRSMLAEIYHPNFATKLETSKGHLK